MPNRRIFLVIIFAASLVDLFSTSDADACWRSRRRQTCEVNCCRIPWYAYCYKAPCDPARTDTYAAACAPAGDNAPYSCVCCKGGHGNRVIFLLGIVRRYVLCIHQGTTPIDRPLPESATLLQRVVCSQSVCARTSATLYTTVTIRLPSGITCRLPCGHGPRTWSAVTERKNGPARRGSIPPAEGGGLPFIFAVSPRQWNPFKWHDRHAVFCKCLVEPQALIAISALQYQMGRR